MSIDLGLSMEPLTTVGTDQIKTFRALAKSIGLKMSLDDSDFQLQGLSNGFWDDTVQVTRSYFLYDASTGCDFAVIEHRVQMQVIQEYGPVIWPSGDILRPWLYPVFIPTENRVRYLDWTTDHVL